MSPTSSHLRWLSRPSSPPALAKLLWRRELAGVAWARLGGWASAAMAVVLVLGLVIFEHDGKIATYAAMVVACALALWWGGFRKRG